jgi:erythromycin esterase
MRRRSVLAIIVGGAAAVDLAVGWIGCSDAPRAEDVAVLAARAQPLDLDRPYARDDYRFLDGAVGSASIVQLGESLHITDELPRIRVRFVRYLHEELGFDTLALEGSLTQAWIAQEHLDHTRDVDDAQRVAWFMLWRTPAMRELMAYVAETMTTPHPLYLTSFDVQIGASAEYQGDDGVVVALFDALRAYAPPPRDPEAMRPHLAAIVRCGSDYDDLAADRAAASAAVDDLEAWIRAAAPRVRPIHAAALLMIPTNFRDFAALCEREGGMETNWQQMRDEVNARVALAIRERVSPAHKVILWAHHSHVAYDATGENVPSMGQHLRDSAGKSVYTIGTFAGHGRVITGELFGERGLPSIRKFGVERMLAAVDRDAYFVDTSRLPADPAAGWNVEQTSRMETFYRRPTILAKDFDGAIYLDRVHPSPFTDAKWLLRLWGFVLEHAVGFAIVILAAVGFTIRAIVRRIIRVVRRRASSPPA